MKTNETTVFCTCGRSAAGIDARTRSPTCRLCATDDPRIVPDGGIDDPDDDPVTDQYPRLKHTDQPVSYSAWTRDRKLRYLTEQYDRIQIAAAIRREIGMTDRLRQQRLDHREIAAISLDMGIQL